MTKINLDTHYDSLRIKHELYHNHSISNTKPCSKCRSIGLKHWIQLQHIFVGKRENLQGVYFLSNKKLKVH